MIAPASSVAAKTLLIAHRREYEKINKQTQRMFAPFVELTQSYVVCRLLEILIKSEYRRFEALWSELRRVYFQLYIFH